MKKVEAFIRHEAFEPIRTELLELGFPSLSISEVKGSGRQKGITERYRGAVKMPQDSVPQMPAMPCADSAPTGSSIFLSIA